MPFWKTHIIVKHTHTQKYMRKTILLKIKQQKSVENFGKYDNFHSKNLNIFARQNILVISFFKDVLLAPCLS